MNTMMALKPQGLHRHISWKTKHSSFLSICLQFCSRNGKSVGRMPLLNSIVIAPHLFLLTLYVLLKKSEKNRKSAAIFFISLTHLICIISFLKTSFSQTLRVFSCHNSLSTPHKLFTAKEHYATLDSSLHIVQAQITVL